MPPRTAATPPRLVDALARAARERPLDRKLLVAPTFGVGRELLRDLARAHSGWVGFDVTTPRALALRLARGLLSDQGLRPIDGFGRQAMLDEALDGALAAGPDARMGELSEGVGFREGVHGAVIALRAAGVSPAALRPKRLRDGRRKLFLLRVFERYESLLRERRGADAATIFDLAVALLARAEDGMRPEGADAVLLVPGLTRRGLEGRFLASLQARGARILATDPVVGLEAPEAILWSAGEPEAPLSFLHDPARADPAASASIELFRAASITDELREVLRRVVARGWAWDQVEIITPSPAVYGSALHALASRLRVPVTYAVGLPVERTRPGRVVEAYLDWIGGGFQASPIRRLLEAGDLRPPRGAGYHAPGDLARRFRGLRIGWGRRRYRTQIRQAIAALDGARPGPWETPEGFERRTRTGRGELEALRSILFPALKATPSVPDQAGEGGGPVAPSELAHGLRAFLRRMPAGRGPDALARDEILRTLDRIEATLRRKTHFEAALTILRRHLDLRVRAPRPGAPDDPDDAGAPWLSEGGHLHLSDLDHGGFAGRPVCFLVGLDADHVPGSPGQDPVLPDADRRAIDADLPTVADLSRERVHRVAALLARLRGRVTLSYGAWDASAARSVGPSPILLQALRVRAADASPTYENLHDHLGPLACAIPGGAVTSLDSDDVWMGALAGDGVLRPGLDLVRATYPRLDHGLHAAGERRGGLPGPFHGVVEPRPELFDPRRNPETILSASRLEALGACPLRYLFATVLRLRPPDDPELDPDRWLTPLQRGSLLHAVYERTLRSARERGVAATDPALEGLALEALDALTEGARAEFPAPGEGVRTRELAALREDVRSFARMVGEHGALWARLELKFGTDPSDAVRLALPGGTVRLRGAIDRIDEDLEGVHVVDYKTGVPRDYETGTGVFNGGRRLQHALYSEAAERIMGREVSTGSYHFPTRRGQNQIVTFERARLRGVERLLEHMLDGVGAGAFVPTDHPDDCRFCDFAEVCRVRVLDWGRVDSPLATWSGEVMAVGLHDALRHLKDVRGFEE